MDNEKGLKAWLNFNCSQGNNWVMLYKFDEIVNHSQRQFYDVNDNQILPISTDKYPLNRTDLSHIYFTYLTEDLLIGLIETYSGHLFLIHNKMSVTDAPEEEITQTDTPVEQSQTIELTDEVIDQYIDKKDGVKKVENIVPLPKIEAIQSNIYHLDKITQLKVCTTKKERKAIGLRDNEWSIDKLKKVQRVELMRLSYMDFIHIKSEDEYINVLNQYIDQCGETLNLTHNYSITPNLLSKVRKHDEVKQLIIYQNFQLDNFQWLKNFPNIKLINLFYAHQIEQKHFEQIVDILPNIEVFNIHFCTRINLRILIPLMKLRHLEKIAIDDPQFWCQRGIHELFILPDEWKGIYCPSLQKIAINSYNLTMDVIDYLLTSCPNITQFIVDEKVMKLVSENIESGYEKDDILVFNSWQNPNKGFQIHKKVSFKNLLKDTYNTQMFSESMLKKIKEHRTRTGEKEQTPIVDRSDKK